MDNELKCLRCGSKMIVIKDLILRIGEPQLTSRFPNGIQVEVHQCSNCGKLEFYNYTNELITEVKCPNCGEIHDRNYKKCPYCKYDYKDK